MALTEILSPTQRRMYELLSDLEWHSDEEIRKCLGDDLGTVTNTLPHLSCIRKFLSLDGKTIVRSKAGDINYYSIHTLPKHLK